MTFEELERLYARAFPDLRPWSASEFMQMIEDPASLFLSLPNAFALGRVVSDEAEIFVICTDPNNQRQGLAQSLLTQFEERAKRLGAARVFLEVARKNLAARRFYERSGYVLVGERPGYYAPQAGDAWDALILQKMLPG